MPTQLSKGHVFVPGEVVDPADLNDLVDLAIARTTAGLITEQTAMVGPAAAGDDVLVAQGGVLKKANVSQLIQGVSSVAMTATPTSVFGPTGGPITTSGTLTVSLDDQAPHKVLAGPGTGTTNAEPSFRLLTPADTNKIVTVAALQIDLDQGNTFFKSLGAKYTLRLVNGTPGQVIKVIVIQVAPGNYTVTWVPHVGTDFLRWPGGTPPVMTVGGAGRTDIYEFTLLQTGTGPNNYYGIRWGANFDI